MQVQDMIRQLMQQYQTQQGLLGPPVTMAGSQGLLSDAQPSGQNTQSMMQNYLQNLFMRRYNPPAIPQQPGMVGSQMGPGGMQYMAPQVAQAAPPGKTEMQRMQEQMAALQAQMMQQQNPFQDFGGGW